jgi:hypothetical protein
MPWTSAYNALFTEALIDQLLAIIYRDMQAALDFISGSPGSLPSFAEYELAEMAIHQFPVLLLTPDSEVFDINMSSVVAQTPIRITGGVAVAHQKPNMVARLLQRYLRAVYLVIRTSVERTQAADFYAPLALPPGVDKDVSAGLVEGSLKLIWIESLAYGELKRRPDSTFMRTAYFSLLAEMNEK